MKARIMMIICAFRHRWIEGIIPDILDQGLIGADPEDQPFELDQPEPSEGLKDSSIMMDASEPDDDFNLYLALGRGYYIAKDWIALAGVFAVEDMEKNIEPESLHIEESSVAKYRGRMIHRLDPKDHSKLYYQATVSMIPVPFLNYYHATKAGRPKAFKIAEGGQIIPKPMADSLSIDSNPGQCAPPDIPGYENTPEGLKALCGEISPVTQKPCNREKDHPGHHNSMGSPEADLSNSYQSGNHIKTDVRKCARCGQDHQGMIFEPIMNPPDNLTTHFSMCPIRFQPIIMGIRDKIECGKNNGE